MAKNGESGEKFWKRGAGGLNFRGLFDYNYVVLGFLRDDVCEENWLLTKYSYLCPLKVLANKKKNEQTGDYRPYYSYFC